MISQNKDSSFGQHDWANDSVIPSTTAPEIPKIPQFPDIPQIPNIPVKIERMGWICGRCGSSNSPDILFCPKCSQQNYYYPLITPQPNWKNEIKFMCKLWSIGHGI